MSGSRGAGRDPPLTVGEGPGGGRQLAGEAATGQRAGNQCGAEVN